MPSRPAAAADRRRPATGPGDRLSATLTLALIAHGIVLLGLGFVPDDPAPVQPTLEVILAQTRSDQAPEHATFLAQHNQAGGGESDIPERPREPQLAEVQRPEPGQAPQQRTAQAPPQAPVAPEPILHARTGEPAPAAETPESVHAPTLPPGEELLQADLEAARLASELERERRLYAQRPIRKHLSADAKEFEWAAYLRAWVQRVERIGNLNYPDLARRRSLSGSLVMTVAVRRDGSVESIQVVRSSGYPALDEAAVRSVRLAEPFPPLPPNRENVDVLSITRTWRYLPGGELRPD